jgi:hypothetical protein
VNFNAGPIIMPRLDSGTMTFNGIREMDVRPVEVAKTPVLIAAGSQAHQHQNDQQNTNQLFHFYFSFLLLFHTPR